MASSFPELFDSLHDGCLPAGGLVLGQPFVSLSLATFASFAHNHFSIATESVSRYAESTMLVSEQA